VRITAVNGSLTTQFCVTLKCPFRYLLAIILLCLFFVSLWLKMRGFRFRNGSSFSKGVFVFVRVFVFVMDLRFRKGLRFRNGSSGLRFRGLRFQN